MRNKNRLFKHQILITAITVFAIVISMIGGSYAIFSSTSKADEYNALMVGELEISYVDTGDGYGDILSLNGSYPISDTEGKNSEPYRFNVVNTGTIAADFKIKIEYDEAIIEEDGCSNNLLSFTNVKYQFDNNEPALLGDKENNSYVIYEGTNLLPGSSEIHEIRMWIDENATNNVLGKHFHGKVVIESIQAGIDESLTKTYSIGQQVTLVDNSSWYVLENSSSTDTDVVLISSYNLNTDGTYNTECGKSINSTTICSPQVFDLENSRLTENNSYCDLAETGCNMYSQNGSSVIYDSTIKTWLEQTYYPLLKESLKNSNGNVDDLTVTLPSMEQLAKADTQTFNQSQITFSKSWLTNTSYWTKTASNLNSTYVWSVVGENDNSYINYANSDNSAGVRPVITTSKLNIK